MEKFLWQKSVNCQFKRHRTVDLAYNSEEIDLIQKQINHIRETEEDQEHSQHANITSLEKFPDFKKKE
jgi:hypothetical protein